MLKHSCLQKGCKMLQMCLKKYVDFNESKTDTIKGSGMRRKKGGNVIFYKDPKHLKKLELIVGKILAGNTSIDMRNMGLAILDTLLKTSTINKSQHNKLYKKYFKI